MFPYFNSLADIEYTIIKHRFDLIFSEAFRKQGGAEYVKSHIKRFNDPELSWTYPETQTFIGGGLGRYASSMSN